ncbi:hypothetical protein FVA81_17560 [Rhizobium sp. WL3]|uniref:hypothetical protein n=1 Tax=Rhizobium sp. WL3 TaxID=2603277 RepID=UPI0011C1FB2D|nr:hypothetical protein [Rhizobium sp. WL3]QEE46306.1 hypothetical protein FVA81_17560 [Rhizobium sp. WL3]
MAIRKIMMTALTVTVLLFGHSAAEAQQPSQDRYSLERSESGFVRLDRQTGAVTLCTEAERTLTCRMAADERAAYDEDLARLEKRMEALEKQIAGGTAAKSGDLPSDAEIDRSIGIMERFMRAFFNLVQEFQGEEQRTEPGTIPDRT